ncbi:hypothetical protein KFL_004230090 [Klebsormidium nitens]|uniref:Uncharacterized protein n=1 Tax=Klebsormidium nitens TaxID=105231 RepID=A0A1Y1II41_KLENI|nr:hypothetical protein KFL_004230090 [Klebsormidium nitens]|eukprot:GAQ88386.1 hypothetical protein KFL_004230090 [Klebsormidium nitens]
MAHYPAYGAQREGRVPGQPASVVMGGLDTISANSEVGQPHPGAPPVPTDRARGGGEKLLGLSVWVQRLRGLPAGPGGGGVPAGGAETPSSGTRLANAQETPRGGAANLERVPPGVPLFGALREFGPRGGVPQFPGARQLPDERPEDEGSAHEGAESPRQRKEEEEANDEPETPSSGPLPTPPPPLPNATNQARGSGPSTGGPVFLGGVRTSTDTASRSVEGPSTADGNPNPNPNPNPKPAASQQRSRGGGYGPSLAARRYGLAEALREQQEAAAVRKWMSKSESGSHAFKASNGTGASGGGGRTGSRPSTEVGLPSPSVGAPLKQFAEAGTPETVDGGGGRREQRVVENGFNARRGNGFQVEGGETRGRAGDAGENEEGRDGMHEDRAHQPRGFGSFGSLCKDAGGWRTEGQPNGLGGKSTDVPEGEGKSFEGSGGSRGGARRGMGSWVERLGIGQGQKDAGNQGQRFPGKEGGVGKTNAVEGSAEGRPAGHGGDDDLAGGGVEPGSRAEAGGQMNPPSEGGTAASNGGSGRRSSAGEGEGSAGTRRRGVKGLRPNGGLSFLPSFRMPPPLVIPGDNQAPETEVQDVVEAGGHALMETPPRTSAPALSPWAVRLGLGGRGGPPPNPCAEPPTVGRILGPSGPGPDSRPLNDEDEGRRQPDDVSNARRREDRRRSEVDRPPGLENGLSGLPQRPPGNPFRLGPPPFSQSSPTEAGGFRRGFGGPPLEEQRFPGGQGLGFEGLERPVFHPGFGGGGPFQSRPFPGPQASTGPRSETPKETFRVPRSPTVRQGPFKLPPSHPSGAHEGPDPFNWSPKGEGFPAFPNPFLSKPQPSTNPDPNPNRINPFVAALQGNPSLTRSRNPDRFGTRPPPHPRPFEDFGKWGAPPMQFGFPPGQGFFGRRSPDSSRGGSSTSPQEAAKGLNKPSLSSGSLQAGGRSTGGANSEGMRPALSGGFGLQGLGQKSMRARLDGVGGLGFRPEGFSTGGPWKLGVFREPRAVPSAHERQVSGDGSCSSFSRGRYDAPPQERPEEGQRHSPLQTSPEALSKPTMPGGWEHPPGRATDARFPFDAGFRGSKADAHAPGGGERSRGVGGESGRRGFGSEFAAPSPDAMRPFSYPSFQETRVTRPGPVEGSGSAATKSVPLDLLRGGGTDRAGSSSGGSEKKGASGIRVGSAGQQADSAGGSGPSSGSMLVGGRSSLGASGLPSPSNPSLGGSSESLLKDLFNPESPVEVHPLPHRRSSAQPLPPRSSQDVSGKAPSPSPLNQQPFAASPRDQALGGGEGGVTASWTQQRPDRRNESVTEGGHGRVEIRRVGEEEREWKAESPDGVVPSGRVSSPSLFPPPSEQHDRSASLSPLPGVNTHRRSRSRFSEGGLQNDGEVPSDSQLLTPQNAQLSPPQNADAEGDRAVPLSKIVKSNRKEEIVRKGGDGLSDGFPQRRWFDRLNERPERDGSPRTQSVNAAVDAAREGLGEPSPKGEAGTVDVNLDRMAAELAEAVAAYGRSTVEAAVRRHLRVAKLKRRADGPERTEWTGSEGTGTDWTNQTETTDQTASEAERTELDGTGAEIQTSRGEKRTRGGEEEEGDSRGRGLGKRARREVPGTEERNGGTGGGLRRVKTESGGNGEDYEAPESKLTDMGERPGVSNNRGLFEGKTADGFGGRTQDEGLASARSDGGALDIDTGASKVYPTEDRENVWGEPGRRVGLGSPRSQGGKVDQPGRKANQITQTVPKPEFRSSPGNGAPIVNPFIIKTELDSSPGSAFPGVSFAPRAVTGLENGPTVSTREEGTGQASPKLTPQSSDSSAAAGRCRSPSTEPFLKTEAAATISH